MIAHIKRRMAGTVVSPEQFPLLRRLWLASFLLLLGTAGLLIWQYRVEQIASYRVMATEGNVKTLTLLLSSLDGQINGLLANSEGQDILSLRENAGFSQLVSEALDRMGEHGILKLKIYDRRGIAVYSSFADEIGGTSKRPELLARALRGETVSEVEQRENFSGLNGVMHDARIAMTYMPLKLGDRQFGVIEIYRDAGQLYKRLAANSVRIFLVVSGGFIILFAVLFLGIARTDRAVATWQRRIAEDETFLESVLENALDAVLLIDENGLITGWNAQAEQVFGWRREEVVGRAMHELLVPERYRESHLAGMKHFLLTGEGKMIGKRMEIFALRRDGIEIPIELAIAPHRTEQGYEFSAFIQDISERKCAEEAMARHRKVVETAMDGFWLVDMQGRLLEVNAAYARISGYRMEELVGMHVGQLEAIDGEKEVRARIERLVANGYERFETRHRRKDGSEMDVEVAVTFLPGAQQFFVFCHDITRRKEAEEKLRIAAVTFESDEAVVITDAQANIIRVNSAYCSITGYCAEEVVGKNPNLMRSGRHDKAFYDEMWQRLLRDGTWSGEIWDRRKNGEVYPKWMTITAVRNPRGEVTHYVGIFSDVTERKKNEQEIYNLAFYDTLTGLPNRRLLLDRLSMAMSASARRKDYGGVLFIDMDRFKVLNDTLGHECGDMLLKEVGRRLKACVREMDTVARLGGDEFVILLEEVSNIENDARGKVAIVAEKIRESLSDAYFLKEHEFHSSPSIGASLFLGADEKVEAVIEQADMAMYQAKRAGRNAVRFFDASSQDKAVSRDALENDLHHAIALEQLHLHYQVQVDKAGQPIGVEAFLRWNHPVRGLLMPGEFLPIAEESSLILDIGDWVMRTACQQIARWKKSRKARDLLLTINISAKQFAQPDFVERVLGALEKYEADPARLKLELSEKMMLDDIGSTMNKIHELRRAGVRMSMDNFGTLYSSLSYIKELSCDQLKIHQEVVHGIMHEGNDARLVQAIAKLAESMDMSVFAEGVETREQKEFLQRHDCYGYQGYLFGKPVELEEFEALLDRLQESQRGVHEDSPPSPQ